MAQTKQTTIKQVIDGFELKAVYEQGCLRSAAVFLGRSFPGAEERFGEQAEAALDKFIKMIPLPPERDYQELFFVRYPKTGAAYKVIGHIDSGFHSYMSDRYVTYLS